MQIYLSSHIHQGDESFDIQTRGIKQCAFNCLLGLLTAHKKPLVEWSPTTLNCILLQGDKLYLKAVNNGLINLAPGVEFLSVEDLPKVVSISCFEHQFSFDICCQSEQRIHTIATEIQSIDLPIEAQNIDLPVEAQNIDLPVEVQSIDLPVEAQNTNLPVGAQNTNLPVGAQNTLICLLEHKILICLLKHKILICLLGHKILICLLRHKILICLLGHKILNCLLGHKILICLLGHKILICLLGHKILICLLGHKILICLLGYKVFSCLLRHKNIESHDIEMSYVAQKNNLPAEATNICQHNVSTNEENVCVIHCEQEHQGLVLITNKEIPSYYYKIHTALTNTFIKCKYAFLILEG